MTIIWHVDNLFALCRVNFELTKLSCYLENIYGPKSTMQTSQKHDYLGVDLDFQEYQRAGVSIENYLKSVIESFPEQIVGKAATPAVD